MKAMKRENKNLMKENKNLKSDKQNSYVNMSKGQFARLLIIGIAAVIVGGIMLGSRSSSLSLGSGIMGFGLAVCFTLLDLKVNSIKSIK